MDRVRAWYRVTNSYSRHFFVSSSFLFPFINGLFFINNILKKMLSRVIPLFLVLQMVSCFQSSGFRVVVGRATSMKTEVSDLLTKPLKFLAMGSLMFQLSGITSPSIVRADEAPASPETTATSSSSSSSIPKVPLLTKRSTDLQAYTDINRGFKMLR